MFHLNLKFNINRKLVFYILMTSLFIFIATIGYIAYVTRHNTLNDSTRTIDAMARENAKEISNTLNVDMAIARSLSQSFKNYYEIPVKTRLKFYRNIIRNIAEENPHILSVWTHWEYRTIDSTWNKNYGRVRFTYYRMGEQLLYKQDTVNLDGDNTSGLYYKVKTLKAENVINPYWYSYTHQQADNILETTLSVPILRNNEFVGLAGIDLGLDFYKTLVDKIKPVKGSYGFLLANDGSFIAHPDKNKIGKLFEQEFETVNNDFKVVENVQKGIQFSYYFIDPARNASYYITHAPVFIGKTSTPWSVGIVVPVSVIMQPANHALLIAVMVAVFGLLALAITVTFIARHITRPITRTINTLKTLAKGEIDRAQKLEYKNQDEIGEMTIAVNKLVEGLNRTAHFARQIGNGDLDAGFEKLGDNDVLGKSLIDMQLSLNQAEEEEAKRKIEDDRQNWITKGIARFSEILRQNTASLEELSYNLMENLVSYTGANQGAIFILNDADENDIFYQLKAAIAFDRRKLLKKDIKPGEELVGRCAFEKLTILMSDVPQDYVRITSGMGGANPRCILLVPLILNDRVYGVIELVSFNAFEKYQVEFVEKIGESIASTIASVKVAVKTAELLKQAQIQGDELASKEEMMRQSFEELQATQDEIERKNQQMEKINEQYQKEKYLMENLMDNIPDAIYFKDLQSRFILASKSVIRRFGLSSMEELAGKSDFDFFTPDHARPAYEAEQNIIRTGIPIVDLVEKETRPDGTHSFVSTTKMPLRDASNQIAGTFGISKDITAQQKLIENLTLAKEQAQKAEKELKELKDKINKLKNET